jgi:hypothetical protein
MPENSRYKIRGVGGKRFAVVAQRSTWWLLILYLTAGMGYAWAQAAEPAPSAQTITGRMAQARVENRARFRPYIVTRNYKLFGNDATKTKSEVSVDVAFVPPGSKKYTIQRTTGSGLGQILVRRMLANEAEITKDYVATDLSADNYNFRFLREADVVGQHCYVLELIPRRKDQHLLHGTIWVDANTYLLRRFEGEVAKPPSWWVRDVRITFVFSDVGGMWLQTAADAVATVRILGHATMVSRDVKYRTTEFVATATLDPINLSELTPGLLFRLALIPR